MLARREWRDFTRGTAAPDWKVLDKWEDNCHLYSLYEDADWTIGRANEVWDDPLHRDKGVGRFIAS